MVSGSKVPKFFRKLFIEIKGNDMHTVYYKKVFAYKFGTLEPDPISVDLSVYLRYQSCRKIGTNFGTLFPLPSFLLYFGGREGLIGSILKSILRRALS